MTAWRQMSRRPFHPRGPAAGRYELAMTGSGRRNGAGDDPPPDHVPALLDPLAIPAGFAIIRVLDVHGAQPCNKLFQQP